MRVESGNQVPAVIGEEPIYARHTRPFRVVPHFLHDAPSAPVISKIQPLLRSSARPGNHADKPVLRIPTVSTASIIRQVAIEIVAENLRRLHHKTVADNIRLTCGGDRDALPDWRAVVGNGNFFAEVFTFPVGGLAVDRDCVGGETGTHDIHHAGNRPAGVLVQQVC
ncbi:hypothetical protein SDC9_140354 [bioreactor metagenome]|uniref:Uncharacterized protein n=1 Tax=bioreactor metagenome TaxID=1076179 RepID=A0A645DVS0_9ZZZZ